MATYYTLLIKEGSPTWSIAFGDYDREVVEQERLDEYSEYESHILRTSTDLQADIETSVTALNNKILEIREELSINNTNKEVKPMTSHEQDQLIKAFIISSIDASGYDDADPKTPEEKVKFLQETFESEYGWNIQRVGRIEAMKEWLMGLPSSINLPFYNHDILEHAVKWGSLSKDATEAQEDKILDQYWHFMANKITQLFDGYHFPKNLDKEV